MAGNETEISNQIRLVASKKGWVLMRNNRGKFRTLDGKRIIEAGLSIKGSSDFIGWQSVIITPGMIGQKIAIFIAVEVKATTKATPEQKHFLDMVQKAGGKAILAKSEGDLI
jgi:hypothetical protein